MRVFIDSSYVDFSKQPTGIPRVVLKYIEAGYEWGKLHDVDIVPVIVTEKGVFPVRPLPGKAPPPSTTRYVNGFLKQEVSGAAAATHLRDAESSLRAALIEAGAPAAIDGLEAGVSSLFAELIRGGKNAALRIDTGPGDVVFLPAYWHDIDPTVIKKIGETGAKIFILVHDILPISFSKFYQAPWRYQFADNLLAAIRNADGIFAVSHYSADGILEFARKNDAKLDRVEVIHNGFDPLVEDDELRHRIDLGADHTSAGRQKYFDFFSSNNPYLMVGTIEPKKGHVPTIESMETLWHAGLDRKLVLVGRRGWLDEQVVNRIEGSAYFGDKLFWFDDLDDVDLYFAYKESRALIFSSYAEGFGIPMVEAAMSRLPVICYETTVSREISGDFGLYYSNFPEFKQLISSLENDDFHAQQRKHLENFYWPSWNKTGFSLFDYLKARAGE